MSTEYFTASGYPSTGALGVSSSARTEFSNIEAGFAKLPTLAGNGSKIVAVNSGGSGLEAITTTGTGSGVRATSPTLVTPVLGVASCTTLNKLTITAPATSATLQIADGKSLVANSSIAFTGTDGKVLSLTGDISINGNGKTLTLSNTLTLAGTDSTTMTFPSTSASIARIDAAQTFAGTQTFSGAIRGADGSAGTPTYSFTNGTNAGMSWDNSNAVLQLSNGGTAYAGVSGFGFNATTIRLVAAVSDTTYLARLASPGVLEIKDGVAAPGTNPGFACIYVDNADGDLKVKFGDGTTKTIVVDT